MDFLMLLLIYQNPPEKNKRSKVNMMNIYPTKFVDKFKKSAKSRLINSTILDLSTRKNKSKSSRNFSKPYSRLYFTTNASTLNSV